MPHLFVDQHIGDRHAARRVDAAGGLKAIRMVLLGEGAAKALKIYDRKIRTQAKFFGDGLIFGRSRLMSHSLRFRAFWFRWLAERWLGWGSTLRFGGFLGIGSR